MYPSAELTELAQRKTELRARIAGSRLNCAALAGEVVRPLNWIDRVVEQWRRIPPMAKIAALPLGLLLRRTVFPTKKVHLAGKALRLLPLVMSAFKLFKTHRR